MHGPTKRDRAARERARKRKAAEVESRDAGDVPFMGGYLDTVSLDELPSEIREAYEEDAQDRREWNPDTHD